MIKPLIHKVKEHKISRIFWQVQMDEKEKKMSKIIEKTKSELQNFEKKIISHIYIFLKELLEISRIR